MAFSARVGHARRRLAEDRQLGHQCPEQHFIVEIGSRLPPREAEHRVGRVEHVRQAVFVSAQPAGPLPCGWPPAFAVEGMPT